MDDSEVPSSPYYYSPKEHLDLSYYQLCEIREVITPFYVCPEILIGKGYGSGCDIWSGLGTSRLPAFSAEYSARLGKKSRILRALFEACFRLYQSRFLQIKCLFRSIFQDLQCVMVEMSACLSDVILDFQRFFRS